MRSPPRGAVAASAQDRWWAASHTGRAGADRRRAANVIASGIKVSDRNNDAISVKMMVQPI
jgi:hypothetical protein